MRGQSLVKYFLLPTALVLFIGLLASSVAISNLRQSPRGSGARPLPTLRERARLGGGRFNGLEGPHTVPTFANLSEMVRNSSAIIIGIAGRNVCRLSADEQRITIDYEVTVQEVLQGNLQPGGTITVKLPGGMVRFEDGSTAEIRTPWFRKMERGQTYILFLTESPDGNGFITTGGPQGVFEFQAGAGMVRSHSGRLRDPMWQHHNMNAQAFLSLVRQEGERGRRR